MPESEREPEQLPFMVIELPVIWEQTFLPYYRFHAAYAAHLSGCEKCLTAGEGEACPVGAELREDARDEVLQQRRDSMLN